VGERIARGTLCPEGGQSTQKLDRVGPTHPKKGVREVRGAEKKSERANNTGQVRGACQTGRQRESCRCAGTHTKKKRRPDCPKRVGGGRFAGGSKIAWIGREK
jgi:hypothetical protein